MNARHALLTQLDGRLRPLLLDKHKEILEWARGFFETAFRFGEHVGLDCARELDRLGHHADYPEETLAALREQGFFGLIIPEEFDGQGLDNRSFALVMRECARVCGATTVVLAAHGGLASKPIINYGTEEQKKKWLPMLASGERIGAFLLTGPESGSDPSSSTVTAKKVDGGYVLDGTKQWISNAPFAGVGVTFANLEGVGWTAFIVDLASKGVLLGEKEEKVGIKASPTSTVTFQSCVVSEDCLLGKPGKGMAIALRTLVECRLAVAAQALGLGECAYLEAVTYIAERKTFDKPIIMNDDVKVLIADMKRVLGNGALQIFSAAALLDDGEQMTDESSIAKIEATEGAQLVANLCVQLHGGLGISPEYHVSRAARDLVVTSIYEGPNAVLRKFVVARGIMAALGMK